MRSTSSDRQATRGRVASEAAGPYTAGGEEPDLAGFEARDEAPTPPLAETLELAAAADRVMARMVGLVQRLHRSGEVEATTGLPIEAWLARHGRLPRADRRMVQTAADVLADMPHTQHGFNDGRISWGQIRSIVLCCRPLKPFDRRVVDEAIADVVDQATSWEPDELTLRVDQLVAELDHRRQEKAEAAGGRGVVCGDAAPAGRLRRQHVCRPGRAGLRDRRPGLHHPHGPPRRAATLRRRPGPVPQRQGHRRCPRGRADRHLRRLAGRHHDQ